MAIVETHEDVFGYDFTLRTIEDWPARLVVRHGGGERVYEITEVSVGRFPENPERVERGRLLVEAFETRLRVLGARKKFKENPQDRVPATPPPAAPRLPEASS